MSRPRSVRKYNFHNSIGRLRCNCTLKVSGRLGQQKPAACGVRSPLGREVTNKYFI